MSSPHADGPRDPGTLFRRVRLDRLQALFEAWRDLDGVTAPEAIALERALLAAVARDRELFSDVLEASFTIGSRGEHAYRFSYAFPGFRGAPVLAGSPPSTSAPPPPASASTPASPLSSAAVASALACAAPFGSSIVASTRRLLRAAIEPAVEQPLIGLAWDRAGAPRHKVYLQFRDTAGSAAAALAERVLAMPGLAARIGDAHLHMLGVDFGPAGITGAKLYIAHEHVTASTSSATPTFAPSSSTPALDIPSALARALPPGRIARNVLAVHRLTGADRAARALPPASDIDFGFADNALAWSDVASAPLLATVLDSSRVASRLFADFRIGVRRLSVATTSAPAFTVYYSLRELEEP